MDYMTAIVTDEFTELAFAHNHRTFVTRHHPETVPAAQVEYELCLQAYARRCAPGQLFSDIEFQFLRYYQRFEQQQCIEMCGEEFGE